LRAGAVAAPHHAFGVKSSLWLFVVPSGSHFCFLLFVFPDQPKRLDYEPEDEIPSIHQSINPSIHQSINPSIHQSIIPLIHSPSLHHSITPPIQPPAQSPAPAAAIFQAHFPTPPSPAGASPRFEPIWKDRGCNPAPLRRPNHSTHSSRYAAP